MSINDQNLSREKLLAEVERLKKELRKIKKNTSLIEIEK